MTCMKFTILVDPSLVIINIYFFWLINAWERIEKGFERNNAISLYDLYGHPSTRIPVPGVMKFTILVDSSLNVITTYMVCLIYAWE